MSDGILKRLKDRMTAVFVSISAWLWTAFDRMNYRWDVITGKGSDESESGEDDGDPEPEEGFTLNRRTMAVAVIHLAVIAASIYGIFAAGSAVLVANVAAGVGEILIQLIG